MMDGQHIRRLTAKATPGTETVPFVGKVAGGGSAVNGAMFIRGVPEDYDLWAAAGNDLWSFEHCLLLLSQARDRSRFRHRRLSRLEWTDNSAAAQARGVAARSARVL